MVPSQLRDFREALRSVRGWGPILTGATLAAGMWTFIELADEVMDGDPHATDRRILLAMRTPGDPSDPLGPQWLEEIARDVTALGGYVVLGLAMAAVASYLAMQRKWRPVLVLLAAVLGSWVTNELLKVGFGRPRPDLVPHATQVYSLSFPSGHAMISAATYLTIAALIARQHGERRMKLLLLGWALLLTFLVGVSRVYLGVHWPSDVLAGWTAGACWALLCWLGALWLQRRGRLEPSREAPAP